MFSLHELLLLLWCDLCSSMSEAIFTYCPLNWKWTLFSIIIWAVFSSVNCVFWCWTIAFVYSAEFHIFLLMTLTTAKRENMEFFRPLFLWIKTTEITHAYNVLYTYCILHTSPYSHVQQTKEIQIRYHWIFYQFKHRSKFSRT